MEPRNQLLVGCAILLGAAVLLGFLPNDAWWAAIKVVAFLIAIFTLYKVSENFSPGEVSPSEDSLPVETNTPGSLAESQPNLHIDSETDVETHFEQFLNTLFPVIKETVVAQTVVLLMVNFSKKKFYVRHQLTEIPDKFKTDAFLEIGGGLPGLVLKEKKSISESTLPENEHLLPYYNSGPLPAKSFLGTPIFFDTHIIGVLCCDAQPEQAFGEDDLSLLQNFAKLISIQLTGSNKLYEYEAENWTTRLLYEFSRGMIALTKQDQIWPYLVEQITPVFRQERLVISTRKTNHSASVIYLHGAANGLKTDQEFPNDEGLIGWVFRKGQSMLVEDFSSKKNYIPRFMLNETPVHEYKSLLATPISQGETTTFVISLESPNVGAFSEQHKKILETMSYQIASFLDKVAIMETLDRQNLFDPDTQIGNQRALLRALEQEMNRAREFNKAFCLQGIKIRSDRKLEENLFAQIISEFVSFTLPLLSPINYIFRLDERIFVILWPERSLQESLARMEAFSEAIRNRKPWANGLVENLRVFTGVLEYPVSVKDSSALVEKLVETVRLAEIKDTNEIEIYDHKTALKPQGE